jgi:hypothetical protein
LFQKLFRRRRGQGTGTNAFFDKAAFSNTRPLENPLVRCVQSFLEILVGDATFRQVMADSGDLRTA